MNEDIIVDLIKQYGQERAVQIALNAGVPVTAIQFALNTPIGQAAQGDFYNMMGDVGSGMKTGALNLSDMLLGTNFITPIGMGPRLPRVDQPNQQAMQMLTPQEQVQQTQQQIINEINQANENNQGGGGGSFVSGPAGMSGPSTPMGPNLVNRAQGGIVTLYGRY
mgnify:CR=1 FL=1|jgi:hypothetical protein|tara:strand:+ start:63 stop:557 length:495 start_codon:yes stop_codon:yes gene_type:complete